MRMLPVVIVFTVAAFGCAERGDPAPAPREAATAPASAALAPDAAPVDAAESDAESADDGGAADGGEARSDGGTPADGGPAADGGKAGDGGIKIVAGALQVEAAPESAAPATAAPKPKPKVKRKRKPKRRAKVKPKAAPKPPPRPARRISPMQTIRSHYGDVHHCYSKVALKDPSIAGRITLQWTIGKTGMPQAVAIKKDTLKDKSVGRCLKARARNWKFPAPSGGVQVISYPFDLRVQ